MVHSVLDRMVHSVLDRMVHIVLGRLVHTSRRGIVRTSSQSLIGRQESVRGPHPTENAVFRFQLAVEVSLARSITDVNLKPPPNVFHGEHHLFRFYQRAASYRRVFAPRALIVPDVA